MKKIFALLIAVVMCVSLFAACGEKEDVIGKVGNIEITQPYYNFIYSINYEQMAQYEMYYGEDWLNMEIEAGKTMEEYIYESTKSQLEQLSTIRIVAKEYGIKVDDELKKTVEEQKKKVVESYEGEEGYLAFLEGAHTTDEVINDYIETYEILNRLFEKLTKKGEAGYIDEKELKNNVWKVQHILISTQADEAKGTPARSDEEALKIANEVVAKLDKGEEFANLIPDYNEDPGMSAEQFYTFGPGEMVAEFENTSKELKNGEYTKTPVKTDYGYHVIKKYEITPEEFDEYKAAKEQEKLSNFLAEKMETVKKSWQDKKIDAVLAEWKKEREAAKKEAQKTENAEAENAEVENEEAENTEAESTETESEGATE